MDSKANKDMDDLSNTGKHAVIALGRQFTIVDVTVAEGDAEIADIYSLGLTDSTSVKIGFFHVCLKTSSNGYSYMNFLTNVIPQSVCLEMNNDFTTEGSVCLPFKNSITIGFPIINAGSHLEQKLNLLGAYKRRKMHYYKNIFVIHGDLKLDLSEAIEAELEVQNAPTYVDKRRNAYSSVEKQLNMNY